MKNEYDIKLEFRGYLGFLTSNNFIDIRVLTNKNDVKKIHKKVQEEVDDYCSILTEYIENRFLTSPHFEEIGINPSKFLSDKNYYFHIYNHQKDVHTYITNWFMVEMKKYFTEIYKYLCNKDEGWSRKLSGMMISVIERFGVDENNPKDIFELLRESGKDLESRKKIYGKGFENFVSIKNKLVPSISEVV